MNASSSRFASVARQFCAFMTGAQHTADEERARRSAVLLASLYVAALELEAIEPRDFNVNEIDPPPTTWKTLAHQYYFEVFDPLVMGEPLTGDIDDDMNDVYRDVARGLIAYDAGHIADAHWHWRFMFLKHWGRHATGALRALHCIIASTD